MHVLPLSGLGLLFGIDRIMATATALTNIVGNTVAVFAIARWEGSFDPDVFTRATGKTPGRSLLRPSAAAIREAQAEAQAEAVAATSSSTLRS